MTQSRILPAVGLIVALITSGAWACNDFYVPDVDLSTASRRYTGPETVSIMILPDGSGDLLSEAFLPDGSRVDGTITVSVRDGVGSPYSDYCQDLIWVMDLGGGLNFCPNGNLPISHTDSNGETQFTRPFFGGGASNGLLQVYLHWLALGSIPGLTVRFNSPDMNGDLAVDLSDVPLFAADFVSGIYAYRSDFHHDGQINLSDLVRMAGALGARCQ